MKIEEHVIIRLKKFLIELKHGKESLLRNLYVAYLAHPVLAGPLLFKKFPVM